jgi:hypothetical protein
VINRGEIVERGRHAELMTLNGLYAGLYRQQMDLAQHELPVSPTPGNGQHDLSTSTTNGDGQHDLQPKLMETNAG